MKSARPENTTQTNAASAAAWRVSPLAPAPKAQIGLLNRLLRRKQPPSLFQRCLALHMHAADPRTGFASSGRHSA